MQAGLPQQQFQVWQRPPRLIDKRKIPRRTLRPEIRIRKNKEMQKPFAVIYKPSRAWLQGKSVSEQALKEHVEYLLGLHERGELVMCGSFSDSSGKRRESSVDVHYEPGWTGTVMATVGDGNRVVWAGSYAPAEGKMRNLVQVTIETTEADDR